jgi:nicotinamide riboside kinase
METKRTKVVFTGPECSGKSTMATILAKQLDWPLVAEFARDYFSNKPQEYNSQDLVAIARGQIEMESNALTTAKAGLICDTDVLTVMIWHEVKFGGLLPVDWEDRLHETSLYFLCKPDFSYALDPLREDIGIQDMLFDLYLNRLLYLNLPFVILEGDIEKRKVRAWNAIEQLLT